MLAIRSYPQGPRVWFVNQRVHHGAAGVALLAAALPVRRQRAALALLGVALVTHDRADWRVWFSREKLPAIVTNVTHSTTISR